MIYTVYITTVDLFIINISLFKLTKSKYKECSHVLSKLDKINEISLWSLLLTINTGLNVEHTVFREQGFINHGDRETNIVIPLVQAYNLRSNCVLNDMIKF